VSDELEPTIVVELWLPDSTMLRREFYGAAVPDWIFGSPPDWVMGARKTWPHPSEPIVLSGHVKEGFEDEARRAVEAPELVWWRGRVPERPDAAPGPPVGAVQRRRRRWWRAL